MSEIEKLRDELQELNYKLSCGVNFVEAMKLTKQVKELEERIAVATAAPRNPYDEPPEYKPGGRATSMQRSKHDFSSPHGSGHDPLKTLFGD